MSVVFKGNSYVLGYNGDFVITRNSVWEYSEEGCLEHSSKNFFLAYVYYFKRWVLKDRRSRIHIILEGFRYPCITVYPRETRLLRYADMVIEHILFAESYKLHSEAFLREVGKSATVLASLSGNNFSNNMGGQSHDKK